MKEIIEKIDKIISSLSDCSLGKIVSRIEDEQVLQGLEALVERLEGVRRDYRLMGDFMFCGGHDPNREHFYNSMKVRVYNILADARMANLIETNSTLKQAKALSPALGLMLPDMQKKLEGFESDLIMTELDIDGGEEKRKAIRARQHRYRQDYFNAILTSGHISEMEVVTLVSTLLSPTIDRIDQNLLISALLMSQRMQYDNRKLLTLLLAFRDCKDEYLHSHLLVALVLSMHDDELSIFADTDNELLLTFSEDHVRQELIQLQLQMFLCTDVDEVEKTLKSDIIPTIMKHQKPLDLLKDDTIEGSSLDEILRPNTSEESIDELEQTIGRIDNMQKKGLDLYFGGFSKMKRDNFFYTLVNWFYPFTLNHPQLSRLPHEVLHGNLMKMLVEGSPLCDSDMYSMALGVNQVYNMLPQKFKDMFGNNELKIRESFDRNTPVYYRRTYLQNLLRFHRLYTSKHDFTNPFYTDNNEISNNEWLFMGNRLFAESGLFTDELISLTKYLFKRGRYELCWMLIGRFADHNTSDEQKVALMLINGLASYEKGYLEDALDDMADVLDAEPDNTVALKYYVMTCLARCSYDEALGRAQHLHNLVPDNEEYLRYYLIAMMGTGNVDEASKEMFRLYFENPDNVEIQRTMAWAYLYMRKPEKAAELFDQLIENDDKEWTTLINAIYAYTFIGGFQKIRDMYPLLADAMKEQDVTDKQDIIDILMTEKRLLEMYGFSRTDLEVLIDAI